jgi:error-prone DNA polymerase
VEHGMIFQRFMNRERKGLPDIDIDFCSRRRDEILAYVYERYGTDHVAAVATLNTFRARSSVREVAKAMGYSPEEIDDIARVFPFLSTRDLRGSLTRSPETANCRVALDAVLEVISIAERITGFPRHLGIHVGGIIITDRPLTDYVPLQQSAKGIVICQYDKDDVEKLGLVKLDLLGLRIHSAVERCLDLVERRTGTRPDIDGVSLDDRATYRTMQEAQTVGCFQLESPGERSLQQRLLPSRFSDVIANISLFRPGPVQGDMITPFVERRRGREPINCLHPKLEAVLRDTYGVILYQEQVIQTIHAMTGLTLDESDALRRAMTRDNASDVYQAIERRFLEGAAARGLSPEEAEQIFNQVTAFAAYGFCKGHAACFGLIAYQTAYLKTHHPAEFLAGVLSNEPMGYYSSRTILEEAKRSGVPILPLDVNASEPQFTVETAPAGPIPGGTGVPACAGTPSTTPPTPGLRIALMQLAGLAERDQEAMVAGRADGPYASLLDFCQRARIAEDSLERLILAGAFDRLPAFRPEPEPEWWEYPSGVGPTHPPVLVRSDARLHRRRLLWLLPFLIRSCGWATGEQRRLPAPDVDLVEREKEIRRRLCEDGFERAESPGALERKLLTLDHDLLHLSALRHPMAFARARLTREGYLSSSDIREQETGQWVRTGGVVVSRNRPPTKSGRTVVFVTLEDELGLFDAVVFERAYQRWRGTIFGYDTLRVEGRVERVSGGAASIIVQAAYPLHPVEVPSDLPLMPGPGDHSGAHTRAAPPSSPRETLAQLDS